MKVNVKTNSWVAKFATAKLNTQRVAIVLGNTIHLWKTDKQEFLSNKKWVCHELTHVMQYRKHGFIGFIMKYLMESIQHGYYNNRFEKEARANETNEELLRSVEFV